MSKNKRDKYLEQQEKRKEYIKNFLLKGEDIEKSVVKNIVDRVFYIGENVTHTHKYNVWIAKEAKKNLGILDNTDSIINIVDWAENSRADIFKFNFEAADDAQEVWHDELFKLSPNLVRKPKLDTNKIIFKCREEGYFFYLLNSQDLKYEGYAMGHCVGGQNYANAVNNREIFIISLRDSKNEPHVTIEINRKTKRTIQIRGKENKNPIKKYSMMITEFGLWASGYSQFIDDDILKVLNLGIK